MRNGDYWRCIRPKPVHEQWRQRKRCRSYGIQTDLETPLYPKVPLLVPSQEAPRTCLKAIPYAPCAPCGVGRVSIKLRFLKRKDHDYLDPQAHRSAKCRHESGSFRRGHATTARLCAVVVMRPLLGFARLGQRMTRGATFWRNATRPSSSMSTLSSRSWDSHSSLLALGTFAARLVP